MTAAIEPLTVEQLSELALLGADRYHLVALGLDYTHQNTSSLIETVAETGCGIQVLNIRGKRPVPAGVVIVRVEDAAPWVQEIIANSPEMYPAALTVKEAALLAGVSPNAIRQQMMRSRRENGNGAAS